MYFGVPLEISHELKKGFFEKYLYVFYIYLCISVVSSSFQTTGEILMKVASNIFLGQNIRSIYILRHFENEKLFWPHKTKVLNLLYNKNQTIPTISIQLDLGVLYIFWCKTHYLINVPFTTLGGPWFGF